MKDTFLKSSDVAAGPLTSDEFDLPNSKISLVDHEFTASDISGHYDAHGRLFLTAQGPFSPIDSFKAICSEGRLSGPNLAEETVLHPTRANQSTVKFMPAKQSVSYEFSNDIEVVEAIVLNGPQISHDCKGKLIFKTQGIEIHLEEIEGAKCYRESTDEYAFNRIVTHSLRFHGDNLTRSAIEKKIAHLSTMLTFSRGAASGIGNIIGRDKTGDISYATLGFLNTDDFRCPNGWCDTRIIHNLPSLFEAYSNSIEQDDKIIVHRTIEYYRASNMARQTSLEVALIASMAGVEAASSYILVKRSGLHKSEALKGSLSDRLERAYKLIGVKSDLFTHLNNLNDWANQNKKGNFETLAYYRNKIAHYKESFARNGRHILEAWLLSQWLCELMVFYILGYGDKMIDRRKYNGWIGEDQTEVPLPGAPKTP